MANESKWTRRVEYLHERKNEKSLQNCCQKTQEKKALERLN
jgi:hypothetical protein